MERERACPETAAQPGRGEGASLTAETGSIEYHGGHAGGLTHSSDETPAWRGGGGVKGSGHSWRVCSINLGVGLGRSRVSGLKLPGKSFEILKAEVWQAWEKVKANKGAPGVDHCPKDKAVSGGLIRSGC